MDIIGLIKNLFGAVGSIFGWARGRDADENAPDIKAAAEARQEVRAVDATNKAIAKKDVDEIRRELAE
jgi:predicted TPR repeat methyltransferase